MKKVNIISSVAILLVTVGLSVTLSSNTPKSSSNDIVFAADKVDKETEKAMLVNDSVDGFLKGYINQDGKYSGEEAYQKLREELSPYVSEDLLSEIAPSQEEMDDMYSEEDSITDDSTTEDTDSYEYSVEITERQIYINYESLDEKTVSTIAYTTNHHNDAGTESELQARVYMELEKEDGEWVVTTVSMEYLS